MNLERAGTLSDADGSRHFFVDEAGDLTLFDRRGRIVVGKAGVSKFFMVGVAAIPDPARVKRELDQMRFGLLADPYFKGVPSMQMAARKTAICFHAKDDVNEVRREVLRILPSFNAKIQVAVRRKDLMASHASFAWEQWKFKSPSNTQYDDLVKRLFKNLLHKSEENRITFARRGKSHRQDALENAISKAKANFARSFGKPSDRPTLIASATPSESAGLQVIDYYLWALQRMYELQEDRYFELLRPAYRLIMDLDDTRNARYGEYYCDSNRIELERIMPVGG